MKLIVSIIFSFFASNVFSQTVGFFFNSSNQTMEFLEIERGTILRRISLPEVKLSYRYKIEEIYGEIGSQCLDLLRSDYLNLSELLSCIYLKKINVSNLENSISLSGSACHDFLTFEDPSLNIRDRRHERSIHCLKISGIGGIISNDSHAPSMLVKYPAQEEDLKYAIDELLDLRKYNSLFLKIFREKQTPSSTLTSELINRLPNKDIENLLNYIFYDDVIHSSSKYVYPNETNYSYKGREANLKYASCINDIKENIFKVTELVDWKNPIILKSVYQNDSEYSNNLKKVFEKEIESQKREMDLSFYKFKKKSNELSQLQSKLNSRYENEKYLLCKMIINERRGFDGHEEHWPKNLNYHDCVNVVSTYDERSHSISKLIQEQKDLLKEYHEKRLGYFQSLVLKKEVSGKSTAEEIKKEITDIFKSYLKIVLEKEDVSQLFEKEIDGFSKLKLDELISFVSGVESNILKLSMSERLSIDNTRIEALKKYNENITSTPIATLLLSTRDDSALLGDLGRWFEEKVTSKINKEFKRIKNRIKEDGIFKELESWTIKPLNRISDEILRFGGRVFCPRDNGGIGGYCLEGGLRCSTNSVETRCVYMKPNGESSEGIPSKKEEDWDSALSWLRQTEMQDFLKDLNGKMSEDLRKAMFPDINIENSFKSFLSSNLETVMDMTDGGQSIPTDPLKKAMLYQKISDLKSLQDFLKGFGNGAINNVNDFKEGVLSLINSITDFDSQEAKDFMISIGNMIYHANFNELMINAGDTLGNLYNNFLQASPERKGEVVGYASAELLGMFFGGALTKGALKTLGGAGKLVKSHELVEGIFGSARKLSLKAKEEIADFVDLARRTFDNEVGVVGDIGKLVDAAQGTSREIISLKTQLQKKFKHAKDFGINGSANKETLNQFSEAIASHVKAPTTKVIEGTYHQTQKVIHYVDPLTGLNVMKDYQGKLISTWKLSSEQLKNVIERGSL